MCLLVTDIHFLVKIGTRRRVQRHERVGWSILLNIIEGLGVKPYEKRWATVLDIF